MIDYNFIKGLEGFTTNGIVPNHDGSQSGVTVGIGVDLGNVNLKRLALPDILYSKLKPYDGLKNKSAYNYLKAHPLSLTDEEATLISQKALLRHLTFLKNAWNRQSDIKWNSIPDAVQTVVFSVIYQYGNHKRVPKFWKSAIALDISGMIMELRDFGDAYPTRRKKEAAYLESMEAAYLETTTGEDNEKHV